MPVRSSSLPGKTVLLVTVLVFALHTVFSLFRSEDAPSKTLAPNRALEVIPSNNRHRELSDVVSPDISGPRGKEIVLVVGTDGRSHNTEEMDNKARENRQQYADLHGTYAADN
jgi:hypothetical protein